MFQRVNRDRAAKGLPPLKYDPRLADVGRSHSHDMRAHKFMEHESPTYGTLDNRLNRAGYLFRNARENLSEAPDVDSSSEGLLHSPKHYANIMATDVTHIGIGIVKGGVVQPGNYMFTQVFATPSAVESVDAARRKLLQVINQQRASAQVRPLSLHPLLTRLAAEHIDEVDPNDGGRSLGPVGGKVQDALAKARPAGISSVTLGTQLLVDSSSFEVPALLLQPGTQAGLALRQAGNEVGRPMLQVLLIMAR